MTKKTTKRRNAAKGVSRLRLELLEDRQLLTINASFDPDFGALHISVDADEDVYISNVDGTVAVNGSPLESVFVAADEVQSIFIAGVGDFPNLFNAEEVNFDAFPQISSVVLFGGEGDDQLIAAPIGSELFGGSGNDVLWGGPGSDLLDAGLEEDQSNGGPGDDTYLIYGGFQTLEDEEGLDTLDFSFLDGGVTVDLDFPEFQSLGELGLLLLNAGVFENVIGTRFPDQFTLSPLMGNASRVVAGGNAFDEEGNPIEDGDELLIHTLDADWSILGEAPNGVFSQADPTLGAIEFFDMETVIPITPLDPTLEHVSGTSDDDQLTINATSANAGTWELITDVDGSNGGPVTQTGSFSGNRRFEFDGGDASDKVIINNPTGGTFAPADGFAFSGGGGGDTLEVNGGQVQDARIGADMGADRVSISLGGSQTPSWTGADVEFVQDNVQRANFEVASENSSAFRDQIRLLHSGQIRMDSLNAGTLIDFKPPTQSLTMKSTGMPTIDSALYVRSSSNSFAADVNIVGGTADSIHFENPGVVTKGKVTAAAATIRVLGETTAGQFLLLAEGAQPPEGQVFFEPYIGTTPATDAKLTATGTLPSSISGEIGVIMTPDSVIDAGSANITVSGGLEQIVLGAVKTTGTVTLNSLSDVFNAGGSQTNVTATKLVMEHGPQGSNPNSLSTQLTTKISKLQLNSTGFVDIQNSGALEIEGGQARRALVQTFGSLRLTSDLEVEGDLELEVVDDTTTQGQDLVVAGGVRVVSIMGHANLSAGDKLIVEPNAVVAGDHVTLSANFPLIANTTGTGTNLIGGVVRVDGTVTATTGPTVINTGENRDEVILRAAGIGAMSIDTGPGTDKVTVNGSSLGDIFRFEEIGTTNQLGYQGVTGSTMNFKNAEDLNINGNDSGDSFQVFPSATMGVQINGNAPTTSPGDSLVIDGRGLSLLHDATNRTVSAGSLKTVSYAGIETTNVVNGKSTLLGGNLGGRLEIDASQGEAINMRIVGGPRDGELVGIPGFPTLIESTDPDLVVRFITGGENDVVEISTGRFKIGEVEVELRQVSQIEVDLGEGNDVAEVFGNGSFSVIGGPGDDTVHVTPAVFGNKTVDGGEGQDDLIYFAQDESAVHQTPNAISELGFQPIAMTGIDSASIRFDPSTRLGDFNRDGKLDSRDIDELHLAIAEGIDDARYDVDGSGTVDAVDAAFWVEDIVKTRYGDTDLDGDVDFTDFIALSANFNSPGLWSEGNFAGTDQNSIETVGFEDFLLLSANFGFRRPV